MDIEETLRLNAEDERGEDGEKADTKERAVKGPLAELDDMDEVHGRVAKQLEKASG